MENLSTTVSADQESPSLNLKLAEIKEPTEAPKEEGGIFSFFSDTVRNLLGTSQDKVETLPSPVPFDTSRGGVAPVVLLGKPITQASEPPVAPTGEPDAEAAPAQAVLPPAPPPKAVEPPTHAEIKAMDASALVGVLTSFPTRANAVAQSADALRVLTRENGAATTVAELGAIEMLVQAMAQHATAATVQLYCIAALRNLVSGDDARKRQAIAANALPGTCLAIAKHTADASICEHGFALASILGSLGDASAEEQLAIKRSFLDSGIYGTMAASLNTHAKVAIIEHNVAMAIYAFVPGEETHAQKAQQAGLIPLIATIVQRKGIMGDKPLWTASRAALGAIIADSAERKKEAKKCFPWGTVLC